MPHGWLNESVSVYTSVEGDLDNREMHTFGYFPSTGGKTALEVKVASMAYLLAMKTASTRVQDSDLSDIERLAEVTGMITFNGIMDNLKQYFPTHRPPQRTVAAVQDIVEKLNR